jgi:mannose-6-phosphate isomerase
MQPIALDANQPQTFYMGGGRISRFRGVPEPYVPPRPEDWVASTTARFGHASEGMTRLADGTLLRDLIERDPVGWLGEEHIARHGGEPGLLVKLLDSGQRLPVHAHPDRQFALEHLGSRYGKTEAWIILEAADGAVVHLGFDRDITAEELGSWVTGQDVGALLSATNRLPVAAGDTILCPAGLPHAIGEGILLVELQEPTDFSMLLEWRGFDVDPANATLGLSVDEALGCIDRRACAPERLEALRGTRVDALVATTKSSGCLLPHEADPFFVAEQVAAGEHDAMAAAFAVLVITSGSGSLETEAGSAIAVSRGDTVVVPFGAGVSRLTGDVSAVRCRPPGNLG